MFCTKCGFELPDGTVFCTSCGARQEQIVVEVQDIQKEGNKKPKTALKWSLKKPGTAKAGNSLPGDKKKRKKIIGSCVAGVAVIALVAGAVVLNQPKTKLMRSAYKTYRDAVKTETGIGEYLGLKEIMKEIRTGKTHQEFSIAGKQDGERLGLRAVINMDKKSGEMGLSAYPMYKNSELTELLMYRNQERTAIALPDLYDGSFYFSNADAVKKFRESALNAFIEQWTGRHGGEDVMSDEDRAKAAQMMQRFLAQSDGTLKQMGKNITVEKIGSKSFTIGGKAKKCKGYEVTVSKKDMKNMLKEVTKFVEKDESPKRIFTSMPRMGEEEFEYFLDGLDEMMSELENSLEDDFVMTLYTGPKGRLVSMEWEYEFMMNKYEFPVKLNLALLGNENPLDVIEAEYSIDEKSVGNSSGDYDKYTYTLLREQTYNKSSKQMEDSGEIVCKNAWSYNGGENRSSTSKIGYTTSFNQKSGAWDATLRVDDDTVKAEGTISDVKKGKSFNFVLDKLKFDNSYAPTFEGQYTVGALGKEPLNMIPENLGDEIDIFDMGLSEIQKIGENVAKKLAAKAAKAGLEALSNEILSGRPIRIGGGYPAPETTAVPTEAPTAETTEESSY